MEHWWNDIERKNLNYSERKFFHYKTQECPGIEPGASALKILRYDIKLRKLIYDLRC